MHLSPFGLVGALVSLAICALALVKGEKPERIGAAALAAGLVLVPVVQDRANWLDPQFRLGVIDALILAVLAYLTLTTRRIWVLYAAAFQLLALAVDAMHVLDPRVRGLAYLTTGFVLGYAVEIALLAGVVQVMRRRRRDLDELAESGAKRTLAYFGDPLAALTASIRQVVRSRGKDREIAIATLEQLGRRVRSPRKSRGPR